jgi:L-2-hydroxyglutarate oxidase LhgO
MAGWRGQVSMEHVDCIVVGAGVVGLACARALALAGLETVVLEEQASAGRGISSRSSEVIHAGHYYATGSLKASLCVEGRRMLYDYLQARGLPHRRLGKLIVATEPAQVGALDALRHKALLNGVQSLKRLSGTEAAALEPAVRCVAALVSPETGIVDSHALMISLRGDLESAGGALAALSPLVRARRRLGSWEITTGTAGSYRIASDFLVNAAGLSAQSVAAAIEEMPADRIPRLHLARGCYFSLSGRAPFTRLIYPMPADGGLGVHLTLDLAGMARFGPDVEWIDSLDYTVDPRRAGRFYPSIRTYWPQLPDGSLQPAYAGIRPKLRGPGEADADFVIQGPQEHGLPGLVHLFGIESPGLTSSLAIGQSVQAMLGAGRAA